MPTTVEGFMSLIEAGWDAEVARRPHGQRTTVIAHLDVEHQVASLHLGPLLSDADRRYLLCDATCEVWFERDGQVIGAGGRPGRSVAGYAVRWSTATGVVWCPGAGLPVVCMPITCGIGRTAGRPNWATWCCCVRFTTGCIIAAASRSPDRLTDLTVTDEDGQPLDSGSLARPPTTPPPDVPPCPGPTGERADWWWYTPFEPQSPPINN